MTTCFSPAALPIVCKDAQESQNHPKQPVLRIVSYNIRHGEGMDRKIDLKRIADVIARENPDLVALQEVDKNCQRSGSRDVAKELGVLLGMDHRFGKSMDFQDGEYGNAVLSRLEILDCRHYPIREGGEPRCALEVKVQVKGSSAPVSFISIHTDPHEENVRVKQIQTLLDTLRSVSNPIILAGDFNAERTDKSLKDFETSDWQILGKNGKKTFPSPDPEFEIDYFIIRGFPRTNSQHDVIDERMASDHRPISAIVTLQD